MTLPTESPAPYILTLDIGTSSTRAVLFDSRARAVSGVMAQWPNHLHTGVDGAAEFDPDVLFETVVKVVDEALHQAGPLAGQIGGVAMATFVTNILGLNGAGQPITPIFTYADTRNAADADALRAEFDLSAVHNRTGCRIHSAYLPARFCWLARTRPATFNTVQHWLSVGEYVLWRFLGVRRASYSVASWTGLLNRHTLTWDEEWLARLDLTAAKLSPLADVDQPLQGLIDPWATRWPALKNVPWFPAIGDGAAANLGSGCTGPNRLALTVGTTGAIRAALSQPLERVPEGLWLYRVNRKYALLGGATSEGGNVFAWLNNLLQLPADVEPELAQLPPAAHGLTLLPFIAGERAPGWRDDARAAIHGLTQNTRPIEILRAGLEAVTYRFALIYQTIAPHLSAGHSIIASGSGLLNSPTWMQLVADVLGRPLTASAEKEATGRGVALLALDALGLTDDKPAVLSKTYHPNFEHHPIYQAALHRQLDLYQKLILETS
jgi:gluconokinase